MFWVHVKTEVMKKMVLPTSLTRRGWLPKDHEVESITMEKPYYVDRIDVRGFETKLTDTKTGMEVIVRTLDISKITETLGGKAMNLEISSKDDMFVIYGKLNDLDYFAHRIVNLKVSGFDKRFHEKIKRSMDLQESYNKNEIDRLNQEIGKLQEERYELNNEKKLIKSHGLFTQRFQIIWSQTLGENWMNVGNLWECINSYCKSDKLEITADWDQNSIAIIANTDPIWNTYTCHCGWNWNSTTSSTADFGTKTIDGIDYPVCPKCGQELPKEVTNVN